MVKCINDTCLEGEETKKRGKKWKEKRTPGFLYAQSSLIKLYLIKPCLHTKLLKIICAFAVVTFKGQKTSLIIII